MKFEVQHFLFKKMHLKMSSAKCQPFCLSLNVLLWWWHNKAWVMCISLQWCHNGRDSVSNHQPHDCFLNRLFRRRSKKTSKLRDTGLCAGNSPGTGEFPAQRASNAEDVSIWWRHHDFFVRTVYVKWWSCIMANMFVLVLYTADLFNYCLIIHTYIQSITCWFAGW